MAGGLEGGGGRWDGPRERHCQRRKAPTEGGHSVGRGRCARPETIARWRPGTIDGEGRESKGRKGDEGKKKIGTGNGEEREEDGTEQASALHLVTSTSARCDL
ncbi:hypothetical protein chiPu_0030490 [Chiloscyllium punctatum]|uniref:Uncharacterized protein n=1 Tax=Chiloscyllium punctatum TaxID=137246 RepID=A0A401TUV6_CHIPU|nr:hypothetical protein [Chiloscyllium punctatum]